MKKYTCILFDLDGTLANTFPGILNSYQYAAEKMGLKSPTKQIVGEAIGAPLSEVYRIRFGLCDADADKAIAFYRQYYATDGVREVEQYEGMEKTLLELKKAGFFLGVTTLKKESFAKEILRKLEILQYFDVVIGMDDKDLLTKSVMIKKALSVLGQSSDKSLLVGDSSYDAVGAVEANVDFIAVTYGFGFKTEEELRQYDMVETVSSPIELLSKLKGYVCSE